MTKIITNYCLFVLDDYDDLCGAGKISVVKAVFRNCRLVLI